MYSIGGNPEAAELAGINTRWTIMKTFIVMGMLAAIARRHRHRPPERGDDRLGTGIELQVIAAAVIGGTSFAGGIGTIAGGVLGAVIMQSLSSGMVLIGVDNAGQDIVVGVVLVGAVGFDACSGVAGREQRERNMTAADPAESGYDSPRVPLSSRCATSACRSAASTRSTA